jgi:protein tyrosine phosphatase
MSILKYKSNKTTIIGDTNQYHNRYCNIKPFDDNIVRLSTNEYINASWMFNKTCIATQGPLLNTIKQFWQMVIDNNTELIIMLTQCIENNIEKCYNYLDDKSLNNESLNDESLDDVDTKINIKINIKIIEKTYLEDNLILRKILINDKIINHIQYLDWNDSTLPKNSNDIIKIIHYIDKYKGNNPFIIHCSAGVGRTGVILTLYHKYHNRECDIDEIIYEMRNERPNMVQNEIQYEFIKNYIFNEKKGDTPLQSPGTHFLTPLGIGGFAPQGSEGQDVFGMPLKE